MCYSSQIWADYRKYVRAFGAILDIKGYVELFWERQIGGRVKIPKAMEGAFSAPDSEESTRIHGLIGQYRVQQSGLLEQGLFKQRKRLADAERTLLTKTTKAATESRRIASNKVDWVLSKMADLRRTELTQQDSRIYPGYYAPVMVIENGQRVVKPMRYQCRPAGKPAFYDSKFPGTYNARRDNLEGFWRGQFGHTHGVMVVNAFYEHVVQPSPEGDVKAILEFRPRRAQDMLVACLWSHWIGDGVPDLLSFAAITDEPPIEVAAAGHDRCIIPIKHENIDRWLNPDPANIADCYAVLDDRERPYFENKLAA